MAKAEPKLYHFVSNRDVTITSLHGYSIAFEKGIPQHVPKKMHAEVLEKGMLACDAKGNILTGVDHPVQEEAKILLAPDDQDERNEKIEAAIMAVVARNNPHDFSAGGVPSAQSLTAALGWKVDPKEIRPLWTKIKPKLLAVNSATAE